LRGHADPGDVREPDPRRLGRRLRRDPRWSQAEEASRPGQSQPAQEASARLPLSLWGAHENLLSRIQTVRKGAWPRV
jgi:hypothetical protein